jgi:translation elongation factor EF-1alpha
MAEREVGKVTHYYTNIGVAIVEVTDTVKTGDRIHIQGATSDFEQDVGSMQVEHEQVQEAQPGDAIGLKVEEKARDGDKIFVVEEG